MRLAMLALLLLSACGGGGSSSGPALGPPESREVHVMAVDSLPPGYLAQYLQDGTIQIRRDLLANPTLAARLLMHESGHAMGFVHLDGGCVMNPDTANEPNLTPCPQETGMVQAFVGSLIVYVTTEPTLRDRMIEAADAWRVVAGRPVLLVQ